MIKFKQGWIGTKEGVKKDIIVKAAAPNKLKDAFIGGCLFTLRLRRSDMVLKSMTKQSTT